MAAKSEGNLIDEIEVTPEMLREGVAAYLRWDSEAEDPEALVAEIF